MIRQNPGHWSWTRQQTSKRKKNKTQVKAQESETSSLTHLGVL